MTHIFKAAFPSRHDAAAAQTALDAAAAGAELGADVTIALSSLFPTSTRLTHSVSAGAIAAGTASVAPDIAPFVWSVTATDAGAGRSATVSTLIVAASPVELRAEDLTPGTYAAGSTITLRAPDGSAALYTVAAGRTVTVAATVAGELMLTVSGANGELLLATLDTAETISVAATAPGVIATALPASWVTGESVATADLTASPGAFFRLGAGTAHADGLAAAKVYDETGLVAEPTLTLGATQAGDIVSVRLLGGLERTLSTPLRGSHLSVGGTVRIDGDTGAVSVVVRAGAPLRFYLAANLAEAGVESLAAVGPVASDYPAETATPLSALIPATLTQDAVVTADASAAVTSSLGALAFTALAGGSITTATLTVDTSTLGEVDITVEATDLRGVTERVYASTLVIESDPIVPAASPNTLAELLAAGTWEVGQPVGGGTAAADGPNLYLPETSAGAGDGWTSYTVSNAAKMSVATVGGKSRVALTGGGSGVSIRPNHALGVIEAGKTYRVDITTLSGAGDVRARWSPSSADWADFQPLLAVGETLSITAVAPAGVDGVDLAFNWSGTASVDVALVEVGVGTPAIDLDLRPALTGGVAPFAYEVTGLPAGVSSAAGVVTGGPSVPSIGAGGRYSVSLFATDSRGVVGEARALLDVIEPLEVLSVTVTNATDGSGVVKVGDTALATIGLRGHPWPADRQIIQNWYTATTVGGAMTYAATGNTFVIPAGVAEVEVRSRVRIDETPTYVPDSGLVTSAKLAITAGALPDVAPVVGAQTAATLDGTTLTIALGAATGRPAPSGSVTALTKNGADALASLVANAITVAPGDVLAWTVTWTNTAGAVPSVGGYTVPVTDAAPPAPSALRVADARAVGGGKLWAWIEGVPADATAVQFEVGGEIQNADKAAGGLHALTASGPVQVRARAVNASGAGAWTALSSPVTPTAESDTKLAVFHGQFKTRAMTAAPTTVGNDAGDARACTYTARESGGTTPFKLAGGGELKAINGADSLFSARNDVHGLTDAQRNPGNWLEYDPCITGADLPPLGSKTVAFYTSRGAGTITVFGACGNQDDWFGAQIDGFDADGDPVTFRWIGKRQCGYLPDGRPFVVGATTFVRNGASKVTVTPDATTGYALRTHKGATICVVARPGILPPPVAGTALGLADAYVRHAGAKTFTGWNDATAASAPSTGVTIRPGFETLFVYFNNASTTATEVRFRKVGTTPFMPAQPLIYCAQASTTAQVPNTAKHRGVIRSLEDGAEYEVQIKQGSSYYRTTVTTLSRKPSKVSAALGVVAGNVTISRETATRVRVARAGDDDLVIDHAEGQFVDLHGGAVGGEIRLAKNLTDVVLRRVDSRGGATGAIVVDEGVKRVRAFGCRWSSFGDIDGYDEWAHDKHGGVRVVSGVGVEYLHFESCHWGSPRHPASCDMEWSEYGNQAYGGQPYHPTGMSAFRGDHTKDGRIGVVGCCVNPWRLRNYNDALGGLGGNNTFPGGFNADAELIWNFATGAADDIAEIEGGNVNTELGHNIFEVAPLRAAPVRMSLAIAHVMHGPVYVHHNLHLYVENAFSGFRAQAADKDTNPIAFKYDAKNQTTRLAGLRIWNETVSFRGSGLDGNRLGGVYMKNEPFTNADVRNMFMRVSGKSSQIAASYYGGVISKIVASQIGSSSSTGYETTSWLAQTAVDADFRPLGSALVGKGDVIDNGNDAGPFGASADIGAMPA